MTRTSIAITTAIERYLKRHPTAADSEIGISQWWLAESGVEGSVDEVKQALQTLEQRGVVEEVVLADGRYVWRSPGRGNV